MADNPAPDETEDLPEEEGEDTSELPDITIPMTRGADADTFEARS